MPSTRLARSWIHAVTNGRKSSRLPEHSVVVARESKEHHKNIQQGGCRRFEEGGLRRRRVDCRNTSSDNLDISPLSMWHQTPIQPLTLPPTSLFPEKTSTSRLTSLNQFLSSITIAKCSVNSKIRIPCNQTDYKNELLVLLHIRNAANSSILIYQKLNSV